MQCKITFLEACKLGVILHAAESLPHFIPHGLLLHELLLYIIYCSIILSRLPFGILDLWVGPRIKEKLVHSLVSTLCSTVERGGVTVIPILIHDGVWMPIQIGNVRLMIELGEAFFFNFDFTCI